MANLLCFISLTVLSAFVAAQDVTTQNLGTVPQDLETTTNILTKRPLPDVTVPAEVPIVNRRCRCILRAANAVTNWTFMKKTIGEVLGIDTEDSIKMPFKETADCITEVAQSCASHCKGLGEQQFDNGHDSTLQDKQTIGDYVCSYLKWKKKYVKVEVRSEAECKKGARPYRKSAVDITKNLCCLFNHHESVWKGTSCLAKATQDPDVFG